MTCLIYDSGSGSQQQLIQRLLPDENVDLSGMKTWSYCSRACTQKLFIATIKSVL
jgi:hypothetical protein